MSTGQVSVPSTLKKRVLAANVAEEQQRQPNIIASQMSPSARR
jgi:hypothetical protein